MHLTYLRLQQFRNYPHLDLQLHPRLNIFVGNNAQGKTNIVEAVYFLSEGHSFRTSTAADLLQWGEDRAQIGTELMRDDLMDEIAVEVLASRRNFFRNGKKVRNIPELTTVLFAPEALRLTKEGPSERRQFLDHLLGQLYPSYRVALRRYTQALLNHNRLLRNEEMTYGDMARQLDGWKTQLIDLGAELTVLRSQGVADINRHLPEAYGAISKQEAPLRLQYLPRYGAEEALLGKDVVVGCLAKAFHDRRDDEMRRRTTLVGPHRDDLAAHIGNKEVRHFASQGEHRSVVLALKRCEIRLLEEVLGHPPILLLDDVASELDPSRNHAYFSQLLAHTGQVFISAVSAEDVDLPETQEARWFSVSSGQIDFLKK